MITNPFGSKSQINTNYTISPTQTSTAGPWKIFECKKKSTGKTYSVFVFDRKSLDSHSGNLSRSSASSFKRAADEVVERLRKEASSLAKLRHPSVLELVEPVEDTRGGGLQFVTEAVTASLASLLQERDDQERSGGPGGRSSRFVTEDADGVRRRRELEIDELEIQKGLLQISKALEFLHENAGLVHGNLTPDAVLVNSKSDWKISGLSFCTPAEGSTKPTSIPAISLSEVLNFDPRLPRFVQLNLDYTSPDFVLDNNLTTSADMFSLGLLALALYNSPHRSPIESHGSLSTCKKLLSSPSTIPTPSNGFLVKSGSLPKELSTQVLPRLITRRPAQRMTAREFQQSQFFDSILMVTIRFLDAFPAKTPGEKTSFLRGLTKVLPSFPKSVMEKKILPALLEELKDKELISLILQNVFKIIDSLPSARRAFGEKVRPSLKEIFITNNKQAQEKDPARDAGLMVVLEHMSTIASNSSGMEFKDDILPIINAALESPTHSVVDAALRGLPVILPVLDFSTIKNELFPVIATIFSKTNSLAIKVRGLQAFVILCGGSNDPEASDGLDGFGEGKKPSSSSSALDKYTMQEKIVPLIKAIKTKEPAVMIAALNVLRIVGNAADAEFVAMDILPILWSMSLGPLLELKQFQSFMELIRTLSKRVEDEQTKKLQELSGSTNGAAAAPGEDFMAFGGLTGTAFDATANGTDEDDFERLVRGNTAAETSSSFPSWDDTPNAAAAPAVTSPGIKANTPKTPAFSWSTPSPTGPTAASNQFGAVKAQQPTFRTVTPDLGGFQTMTPSSTQFSQPLQPLSTVSSPPALAPASHNPSTSIDWSAATSTATSNPWGASSPATATPAFGSTNSVLAPSTTSTPGFSALSTPMSSMSLNSRPSMPQSSSFSLAPPPTGSAASAFSLPPPPGVSKPGFSTMGSFGSSSGNGAGMSFGGQMGAASSTGMGMGMSMGSSGMGTGMGMGMGGGPGMGTGMGMGASMNSMASLGGGVPSMNSMMGMGTLQPQRPQQPQPQQQQASRSGLDKYESLL